MAGAPCKHNTLLTVHTYCVYLTAHNSGSVTRGYKTALLKTHCRLDIRKYTFLQRTINNWNKLRDDCINASSVNV